MDDAFSFLIKNSFGILAIVVGFIAVWLPNLRALRQRNMIALSVERRADRSAPGDPRDAEPPATLSHVTRFVFVNVTGSTVEPAAAAHGERRSFRILAARTLDKATSGATVFPTGSGWGAGIDQGDLVIAPSALEPGEAVEVALRSPEKADDLVVSGWRWSGLRLVPHLDHLTPVLAVGLLGLASVVLGTASLVFADRLVGTSGTAFEDWLPYIFIMASLVLPAACIGTAVLIRDAVRRSIQNARDRARIPRSATWPGPLWHFVAPAMVIALMPVGMLVYLDLHRVLHYMGMIHVLIGTGLLGATSARLVTVGFMRSALERHWRRAEEGDAA